MFLDASAIVAMAAGEPDAARFATAVTNARERFTSPIAIYESTLAVARPLAIDAFARFGKDQGHPAQLN